MIICFYWYLLSSQQPISITLCQEMTEVMQLTGTSEHSYRQILRAHQLLMTVRQTLLQEMNVTRCILQQGELLIILENCHCEHREYGMP